MVQPVRAVTSWPFTYGFHKMLVKLSPKEMSMCEQAATLRWQLARASNVANQRRDQIRSDGDIDLIGVKAEMAVAKVFDIDYNPFQLGVDSGKDLWLGDISVDVKATFHGDGRLLFKTRNAFKADCAVLVCVNDPEILDVVGCITKKTFRKECQEGDLGHGACVYVWQESLQALPDLWLAFTERRLKFND